MLPVGATVHSRLPDISGSMGEEQRSLAKLWKTAPTEKLSPGSQAKAYALACFLWLGSFGLFPLVLVPLTSLLRIPPLGLAPLPWLHLFIVHRVKGAGGVEESRGGRGKGAGDSLASFWRGSFGLTSFPLSSSG